MARIIRSEYGIKVWLSANDTYRWAHKPGASWPCSQLSGKRIFADFDQRGYLMEVAINGRDGDCDINEFNAIMEDFLKTGLGANENDHNQ